MLFLYVDSSEIGLLQQILATPNNHIKVAGVAIGDGCLGTDVLW